MRLLSPWLGKLSPIVYTLTCHCIAGAKRLGHGDDAAGYWDLHIGEDLRHGKQMIEDVVVPLTEK